jgi:hypothetical protein
MIGEAITRAMVAGLIAAFVAGGCVFAVLFFGVPWLWAVLKPLIHGWTA